MATENTNDPVLFFKLKGSYYQLKEILSVRQLRKPVAGFDGVDRDWVVRVSKDAMSETAKDKHRAIWATAAEIQPLLDYLERENG